MLRSRFLVCQLGCGGWAVPATAVGVAAAAAFQQADVDVVVLGREAEDLVDHVQHGALGAEVGADFGAAGRVHVEHAALACRVKHDGDIELSTLCGPVDDVTDRVSALVRVLQSIAPLAGVCRGNFRASKEVDFLHSGSPEL